MFLGTAPTFAFADNGLSGRRPGITTHGCRRPRLDEGQRPCGLPSSLLAELEPGLECGRGQYQVVARGLDFAELRLHAGIPRLGTCRNRGDPHVAAAAVC